MSSEPQNEPKAIPHAGRPRGDAWRALQAEGIEWETQVLLGKEDHPLSARLIVTSQRLAFARGGEIVLDISRWWLKRPPFLSGNGAINLRIETGSGHRDRMQFIARDGREAATDLLTLLTHGKQASPSAPLEPIFSDIPPRTQSRRASRTEPDFVPDVFASIAGMDEHKYAATVIDATTLQVLETTDFPPLTEAASPSTHRESAPRDGRGSSEPITISTLANQSHRAGEWSLNPIAALSPRAEKIGKSGWAFRLSGLLILIAVAIAFSADRLPSTSRFTDRGKVIDAPGGDTPTSVSVAQSLPTATATVPVLVSASEPTVTSAKTAISQGVGGETIEATLTATDPTTEAALASSTIGMTDEPTTVDPAITETAIETATVVGGVEETVTIPVDTTPEPSATDDETVAIEPTLPDMSPTETASMTATAEVVVIESETATSEPTSTASATAVPTETATLEPTPTDTAEATATPGFPGQVKTVNEAGNPEQVFATGAFRYTIEYAERAAEIPNLELPEIADGEWVVVVLHAENWSDEPATLNMADFQLLASGDFGWQFIGMDAKSPEISQFLGFDPILQPADLSSIKDGEGIRLAFVFVIPPSTTGMELIDDTSGLNLGESLAIGGDVTALGAAPSVPDLVPAVVTDVIDGKTIVVEADGFSATISYLGINVPTGDQCFSGDATVTNSNIVLGQTVYLEREFRNRVSTDGDVLARDVWIDNQQGGLVLVAAWMASEGAAVASPSNQDTRFAGWIQAAAGSAEANSYGFWATCGAAPVEATTDEVPTETEQAALPIDPLLSYDN